MSGVFQLRLKDLDGESSAGVGKAQWSANFIQNKFLLIVSSLVRGEVPTSCLSLEVGKLD